MNVTNKLQTWIEISRSDYIHNLNFFKTIAEKNSKLRLVVKANAYGHGIEPILQLAQENDVHTFAVHSYEEALQVWQLDKTSDILIMGPLMPDKIESSIEKGFQFVVYDSEQIEYLKTLKNKTSHIAKIHLKVETGTNRLGMPLSSLRSVLTQIKFLENIKLFGLYTHFANIEDSTDHRYALNQLHLFRQAIQLVQENGLTYCQFHTACSAAVLLFPETHFDFVRLGLSQYGLWPSRETFVSYQEKDSLARERLRPILSFRTRVGQVKSVSEGQYIGYGCTYRTTRDSKIAVLPVGYSDGIDRKLSNNGYVLINGKRAPIRGRICMNLTMVDVTDIPHVRPYDIVTIIGSDGSEQIRVEDLSALTGTIQYETVSRLNPSIPRIII